MKTTNYLALVLFLLITGCRPVMQQADVNFTIEKENVISTSYLGNGVQWDPYQLDYGKGRVAISNSDWEKLYARLDHMRPQFIRMMVYTTAYLKDGKLDMMYDFDQVGRMLDYCQKRDITVMLGDWGGNMVDPQTNRIDTFMLSNAARYADFLVNEKGYSCIKYYNMINEPNGDWSSNQGNYALWAKAIRYFYQRMCDYGLADKLGLAGPDAAIWDTSESWWVDSCATKFGGAIHLYDIHTYPPKSTVNSGEYSKIIRAYKEKVPAGSQIIMGEIGLKFLRTDTLLEKENNARIARVPHASRQDSQMFVYDHFYGVDMADALFQTMNEGFSGALIWMLDDAMHSKTEEGADKLKIWGFWNILGEEYFGGPSEEAVRTPYYAWSLVSKYIPKGCTVYAVKTGEEDNGVRAVVVEADGKYTLGVLNVSGTAKTVSFRSNSMPLWNNVRQYQYVEGQILKEGDCTQLPNATGLKLDFENGLFLELPTEGLIVYTNME